MVKNTAAGEPVITDTTIAAIATPLAPSGIGVIRMSGRDAVDIASRVFRSASGQDMRQSQGRRVLYGTVTDRDGEVLDEILMLVLRAPHSYTGEDTVELDCHGGPQILRSVLERLLEEGAVMAMPGEFSKRAFLNGKMDLSQAEAVMDMIGAKTQKSQKAAAGRLTGKLGQKIQLLQKQLMDLLVLLEVAIDYPEYEIEEAQELDEKALLTKIRAELCHLLDSAATGRMLNEGARVVLCGRPNVGKSTLLNVLLGEERAIVTQIAGTTRDTIEGSWNLNGIPVCLIDTAGIRDSEDPVEQLGVQRSREAIRRSDLVLLLSDAEEETKEDRTILETVRQLTERPVIRVRTKADLSREPSETASVPSADPAMDPSADPSAVSPSAGERICIAAIREEGLDVLRDAIKRMVTSGAPEAEDGIYLANLRQEEAVRNAVRSLEEALQLYDSGLGSDMVSMAVSAAYDALGEVTGSRTSEELVDTIFSRFCLGK